MDYTDFGTYIKAVSDVETMIIPIDTNNAHYSEYLNWVSQGNTAPTAIPPGEDLDSIKAVTIQKANQSLLNKLAQGFTFQGHNYPTDIPAQTSIVNQWNWYQENQNAQLLGFQSSDAGWITMDLNTFTTFQDSGRLFVYQLYQSYWTLTGTTIPNASTVDDVKTALTTWENS
jgi:hypothetical protein